MNIFNKFFQKKIEKKNSSIGDYWGFGNIYDIFGQSQNYLLTKILAVNYYTKCSPIYNAIDMIAEAIQDLAPMVWDKEKEIWIKNHPVLNLLQFPNADITWQEFVYGLVSFYLVTGDAYITSSGFEMKPPKELYIYPSIAVTVLPGSDGFAKTLQTTMWWKNDVYYREEINKRFRYFNAKKTSEILHIKAFNPTLLQSNVYGMSPLNPIYYEINQQQSANRHNLSLLERGANTSGVINLNPPLDHDAFIKFKEEFMKTQTGSNNAGKVLLMNGAGTYETTTMNNKDMDFIELKKEVTNAIYKNLKIPLALVNTDSMTLDNMTRAVLLFYDKAVLPLANRIFSELSNFLMPLYPGSENLIISYDEGNIVALEPRRNEQLKVLKDLGIFTINQLRALVGAESLEGGNVIYGAAMNIPIATDTQDKSIAPKYDDMPTLDEIGGDDEEMGAKKTNRVVFSEILKAKIDAGGNRLFTDEEINKLADKHGLQ